MVVRDCARSIDRPSRNPDDESFCANIAVREVVITFNGQRFLVPVCGQHGREHDDAAARRRQARKAENDKHRKTTERRLNYVREHSQSITP